MTRPVRLLDQVREAIRVRRSSYRTEQAYVHWVKRFILFHGKRHPAQMGAAEVTEFLSDLATRRHVSPSTQNQALSAILFLYRNVLEVELPRLDGIVRATRPPRVPQVFTRAEVRSILAAMSGVHWLMASLLYGSGCGWRSACGCGFRTCSGRTARSWCATARGGRAREAVAHCASGAALSGGCRHSSSLRRGPR
jgi:site-specific recombinase XerD